MVDSREDAEVRTRWLWMPPGRKDAIPLGGDADGCAWIECRSASAPDDWGVPYATSVFKVDGIGNGSRIGWLPKRLVSANRSIALSPCGTRAAYIAPGKLRNTIVTVEASSGRVVREVSPRTATMMWMAFARGGELLVEYGANWDPERRAWAVHDLTSGDSWCEEQLGQDMPRAAAQASLPAVVCFRWPGNAKPPSRMTYVSLDGAVSVVGTREVVPPGQALALRAGRVFVDWPLLAVLDIRDPSRDVLLPGHGSGTQDLVAPYSGEWVASIENGRDLTIWSGGGAVLSRSSLPYVVVGGAARSVGVVLCDGRSIVVSAPGGEEYPGRSETIACVEVRASSTS